MKITFHRLEANVDTKSPDYGSRKISSRSFIKKSGNSKDNEMRRQHCAYSYE